MCGKEAVREREEENESASVGLSAFGPSPPSSLLWKIAEWTWGSNSMITLHYLHTTKQESLSLPILTSYPLVCFPLSHEILRKNEEWETRLLML